MRGELRGPVRGWGSSVQVALWVRGDGWLRADLAYDLEGRRMNDVLVWTPDTAFVVDRHTGKLTLLGQDAGCVDAVGGTFRVEHCLWLLLGRVPGDVSSGAWQWSDGEWRGRMGSVAARGRPRRDGKAMIWTEIAWRDLQGRIRRLEAQVRRAVSTPWGRVPTELSLEGTELTARAVLRWEVESIPAPGDSLFDPLWSP
jgi:hypothetical protein